MPVEPVEVAGLTDVRGEFFYFAVDRDLARIRAGIIDQRQPISARRHNFFVAEGVECDASVKGCLQDRGARSRHRRMTLWIGRMLRGSFRKGMGEEICTVV